MAVGNLFTSYIDIYNNGVFGFADKIIPNRYRAAQPGAWTNAANLLVLNKDFIASEVATFFANTYPYATYIPGKTIFGDVQEIVDSITFDILGSTVGYESNRQTLTKAALNYSYSTTF